VARTLALLEPLVAAEVPLVCEHGDLSEPNLIWLEDGRLGVVDWELAVLDGLPAQDLCFFLAYAAFARARAESLDSQRQAFHEAFVAPRAWARPTLASHLETLDIDPALAAPLVVACFARRTAALLARIDGLRDDAIPWIRQNRYYGLWAHALDHVTQARGPAVT
jgi:aminoglycoside phosphotransferase (APT) family kinase protein